MRNVPERTLRHYYQAMIRGQANRAYLECDDIEAFYRLFRQTHPLATPSIAAARAASFGRADLAAGVVPASRNDASDLVPPPPTEEAWEVAARVPTLSRQKQGTTSLDEAHDVAALWLRRQQIVGWEQLPQHRWEMLHLARCRADSLVGPVKVAVDVMTVVLDQCDDAVAQNLCRLAAPERLWISSSGIFNAAMIEHSDRLRTLAIDAPWICGISTLASTKLEDITLADCALASAAPILRLNAGTIRRLALHGSGVQLPEDVPELPKLRHLAVSVRPEHESVWLEHAVSRRETFFSFSPEAASSVPFLIVHESIEVAGGVAVSMLRRPDAREAFLAVGILGELRPGLRKAIGVRWSGRAFEARGRTEAEVMSRLEKVLAIE